MYTRCRHRLPHTPLAPRDRWCCKDGVADARAANSRKERNGNEDRHQRDWSWWRRAETNAAPACTRRRRRGSSRIGEQRNLHTPLHEAAPCRCRVLALSVRLASASPSLSLHSTPLSLSPSSASSCDIITRLLPFFSAPTPPSSARLPLPGYLPSPPSALAPFFSHSSIVYPLSWRAPPLCVAG